ncbi:MAG: phage holin family protein [Rikenellaceae bacterium]|nr:phage holin family protein [Rikenellaceae bacterium]
MENCLKYLSGVLFGIASFFAPVHELIVCTVLFIGIDFVTGVAASRKRALRQGEEWGFESHKAWRTVLKTGFVMTGIVMAWMIDRYILAFAQTNLANLFTGFVCGVEFWSYLENAAEISEHPVFNRLRRYMKRKLDRNLENEEDEQRSEE